MKIFITTQLSDGKKSIITRQNLPPETENIKHEIIEIEPLADKDGFSQKLQYNNDTNKYEFIYEEIPKTESQLLKEQLTQTEQALQDLTLMIMGGGV